VSSPQTPAPGERWTVCTLGHVHWGANGGAGLLFRHAPAATEPKFLLSRRSRLVDEPGKWGIPGGAIRDGESPEAAARREVQEEIASLPPHRITGSHEQDCGGGWRFVIFIADVEEQFAAYCQRQTDATGWFTAAAAEKLELHPGIQRWLIDNGSTPPR